MKKVLHIPLLCLTVGAMGGGFFYLKTLQAPHSVRGPQLVPAETILFAHLPDLKRTRLRWPRTSLARLWQEPEMQAFAEKPLAKFFAESSWAARLENLRKAGAREFFVALVSIDGPMPQAVLGLSFSGSRSQMAAALEPAREALKKAWPAGKADVLAYAGAEIETFTWQGSTVACGFKDEWCFVATSLELLKSTLDRYEHPEVEGGKALGQSEVFARGTAPLPADRDALLFVQMGVLSDRLASLLNASGQSSAQPAAWQKTQAIAFSSKLDGEIFRDALFVLSPGHEAEAPLARHSLVLTDAATTQLYFATALPRTLEVPETVAAMAALWLPALEPVRKAMEKKHLVAADLTEAFGPELGVLVDWNAAQPGVVIALDVRDLARARAFSEVLTDGVADSGTWTKKEQAGVTLYNAPALEGGMAPTLALDGRFLVLGLDEGSVGLAWSRMGAAGQAPIVPTSGGLLLPTGGYGYANLAGFFERLYGTFRPFLAMSLAFAPDLGQFIDAGKLPAPEVFSRHLGVVNFSQSTDAQGTLLESTGTLTVHQALAALVGGGVAMLAQNAGGWLSNPGLWANPFGLGMPGGGGVQTSVPPPLPQSVEPEPKAAEAGGAGK